MKFEVSDRMNGMRIDLEKSITHHNSRFRTTWPSDKYKIKRIVEPLEADVMWDSMNNFYLTEDIFETFIFIEWIIL